MCIAACCCTNCSGHSYNAHPQLDSGQIAGLLAYRRWICVLEILFSLLTYLHDAVIEMTVLPGHTLCINLYRDTLYTDHWQIEYRYTHNILRTHA